MGSYIAGYEVLYLNDENIYSDSLLSYKDPKNEDSHYRLFYSEINQSLVLAEIVESFYKSEDYISATLFSKGIVFLLEIKDGVPRIINFIRVEHD
jgi:hypothetical protein